ncbi:TPA: hypothetical protein P6N57_003718 [Pseudomonas aeruginosa]|nr:hypothetical protein [Pseudomonas aeruginosa]HDP3900645.1 hypothetical protein [Pseudomonas aeruginosa]
MSMEMNKANECTCPSGDGSLVHPCPAHPSVEQAGGDERAAFEAYRDRRNALLESEGHKPGSKWHVTNAHYPTWEASRAALAQRSEFHQHLKECADEVATWPSYKREALTQPSPAQTQPSPAPTLRAAIDVANDRFEVPVAKWGTDLVGEEERPEVVAYFDRNYPSTGDAFIWSNYEGSPYEPVMTVAQHDRIVGALRAENAKLSEALDECDGDRWKLRSERDAANARLHEVATACATAEQQRDAALARVVELERQEPVATVAKVPGEDWNGLHFYRDLQGMQPGTKLYAAPVAQAGQVPEGVRILLARAQGQIEHLAECTENLGEDLDDDDVSEDVAEAREVAEEIAELLATAPGKEVGHE